MKSSLTPRYGRRYRQLAADAAALQPGRQLPGDDLIQGPAAAGGSRA